MHINAETAFTSNQDMSCDVCIIGSGAAGITIAKELSKYKFNVILIESGQGTLVPEIQQECSGPLHYVDEHFQSAGSIDSYQRESRKRRLGGSTHCWANYCREFDPIDFEYRDWLPNSGWHFTKKHLQPYYDRAYEYAKVQKIVDDAEPFFGSNILRPQVFRAKLYPTVFSEAYSKDLHDAGVKVITGAHFIGFKMQQKSVAKKAVFKTRNNLEVRVRAHEFVMAMGGIENTRMLLNQRKEIGNLEHTPELGLFFMEHMHVDIGRIVLKNVKPGGLKEYSFAVPNDRSIALTLSEQVQRDLKLVNGQVDIDERPLDGEFMEMGADETMYCGRLRYIMGHTPSPASHMALTKDVDRFGLRKLEIRCHFDDVIWRSMEAFNLMLSHELGSNAVVKPYIIGKPDIGQIIHRMYMYGSHHMGTTRMGQVVESDCRVRETHNIYVAGSSTFNTVGHAPPTLTIIAMAIRLADDLRS